MTLDLYEEFRALVRAIDEAGVPYAVVGAMALAIHGVARATEDIDILIRPEHVDRAKRAAADVGYTAPAAPMTFSSGVTVQRVTKFEGKDHMTLDLLLAEGPLEDIWDMRMQVEADDEVVSTVTREGLIRMKSLSGRLKDMADIEQLEDNDG